jgi:hypothetical protein
LTSVSKLEITGGVGAGRVRGVARSPIRAKLSMPLLSIPAVWSMLISMRSTLARAWARVAAPEVRWKVGVSRAKRKWVQAEGGGDELFHSKAEAAPSRRTVRRKMAAAPAVWR